MSYNELGTQEGENASYTGGIHFKPMRLGKRWFIPEKVKKKKLYTY